MPLKSHKDILRKGGWLLENKIINRTSTMIKHNKRADSFNVNFHENLQ